MTAERGSPTFAGMNQPFRNPWQTPLPTPVNPAAVENARIKAVLSEAKFASRKLDFAKLLFEQPGENPLKLIQILFPDPNDLPICIELAGSWPGDPEVLRHMDRLRRPGNTPADALPDKEALAMRYMQIADHPRTSPGDRLKALQQYQTLMGMDPPKSVGNGSTTNVQVNLVEQRRVFVLPKRLSPDEWEAKHSPKQIELTANAPADE